MPNFRLIAVAACVASLACAPSRADEPGLDPEPALFGQEVPASLVERPDVQAFISKMVSQHDMNEEDLIALFQQVKLKPSIVAVLDRPATSRPWYQFAPNFLNDQKIRDGADFWQQQAHWLEQARARYGVPEEIVVAILGIETGYGRNIGSFRAMDALSTVAFDYPRRAEYFQEELENLLLLAREEAVDPLSLKSSYAGALGWPQFMPSSFRRHAIDFDDDGHRDIWRDPADAIGSVAHYLKEYGWIDNGPDISRAIVDGTDHDSLLTDKFNLHYSVAELQQFGVKPVQPIPAAEPAVLFTIEVAPGELQYWLGYNNFYTITRYNRSVNYAMAVLALARRLREVHDNPDLMPEPKRQTMAVKPGKKLKKHHAVPGGPAHKHKNPHRHAK